MSSHHRSSPRPSSMGRRDVKGFDECDVHTGWYRFMCRYNRAGQRSKIKRFTRRRERMEARRSLRKAVDDD